MNVLQEAAEAILSAHYYYSRCWDGPSGLMIFEGTKVFGGHIHH